MAEIKMAFCCQKYEQVHYTFHCVFLENQLSDGFVNGESYKQKILESHPSEKSDLAQAITRPRYLKCR